MKGFYRAPSQALRFRKNQVRNIESGHVVTTEVQTLEQALAVIENRQRLAKANATRASHADHPSLAQELTRAKLVTRGHNVSLANGDVHLGFYAKNNAKRKAENPKLPHPYRDLPEDEKPAKARAMLASGDFGIGARCGRELAKLFGVSHETMSQWLGIEVYWAYQHDPRYKKGAK